MHRAAAACKLTFCPPALHPESCPCTLACRRGHEHECLADPWESAEAGNSFSVMQPGSSGGEGGMGLVA